jgi:hypothetical protein
MIKDSIDEYTTRVKLLTPDSLLIMQSTVYGEPSQINLAIRDTTTATRSFGNDILNTTLWTPLQTGGCLPQDVCYNATYHKYYLFGGRKVVIINASNNTVIKSLTVSRSGLFNGMDMWYDVPLHRIVLSPDNNFAYCATDGPELAVIDCSTDEIVSTFTAPEITNLAFTSLKVNAQSNKLFWLLNDIMGNRIIKKFDIQTNQFDGFYTTYEPIYDIECNSEGSKLYISQAIMFKILNASNFSPIQGFNWLNNPPGTIKYTPSKVYVDRINDNNVTTINPTTNTIIGNISISNNPVSYMEYCSSYNKLFCTSMENKGVSIINGNTSTEVNHFTLESASGIAYNTNNNKVYCGGNSILPINPNTNNSYPKINTGHRLNFRLAYNDNEKTIISANSMAGSTCIINSNNEIVSSLQIGGAVYKGCYNSKNNKIYFLHNNIPIATYVNDVPPIISSFVTVINGTDNSTQNIPLNSFLTACCYNSELNKVYIIDRGSNTIKVLNGETNELIRTISIPQSFLVGLYIFSTYNNKIFLSANNKIYIIDAVTDQILSQISVNGCVHNFTENTQNHKIYCHYMDNNKVLVISSDNFNTTEISIQGMPFSLTFNPTNNYLYCASRNSYDYNSKITVIDGTTNAIIKIIPIDNSLIKLEYCSIGNKLYGLYPDGLVVIDAKNNIVTGYIPISGNSYGSTMIYNKNNNRLYVHTIFNSDAEMSVHVVDCYTDEICSNVLLNQNIKPGIIPVTLGEDMIFNPVNNRVYCGNHGFSNISIIDCAPENIYLKPGWNWLSFPRLERTWDNPVDAIGVLEDINPFPGQINFLGINNPTGQGVSLSYYSGQWISNNLDKIRSSLGYKLYTDNQDMSHIPTSGKALDPATSIDIFSGHENWIGYFLNKPQTPEQAFGSQMDNLYLIKTQNWTMAKINNRWASATTNISLKYGDMVVVKCTNNASFQWNNSSPGPAGEYVKSASENFTYKENADYLPIYIELEPGDAVKEIGAFVDNKCIGAAVISDTLIEVNAYLPDSLNNNQQIEFVKYYGTKSTPVQVGDYWVYNPYTLSKGKRKILCDEKVDYQLISFKEKDELSFTEKINIQCYPNPFSNTSVIRYFLPQESTVSLKIFSLDGKLINTLNEGSLSKGNYKTEWNGNNENGSPVPAGIYICRMTTNHNIYQLKMVFIK